MDGPSATTSDAVGVADDAEADEEDEDSPEEDMGRRNEEEGEAVVLFIEALGRFTLSSTYFNQFSVGGGSIPSLLSFRQFDISFLGALSWGGGVTRQIVSPPPPGPKSAPPPQTSPFRFA